MGGTLPDASLMQSYFLYSALLALKLMSGPPMAAVMYHSQRIRRANVSDLKYLTPFWLIAAFYMTTNPNKLLAKSLLRCFFLARCVLGGGYLENVPINLVIAAFFLSFGITSYMAGSIIYTYRNAV